MRIGQEPYDELAIMCLLAWPAAKIGEVVLVFRERLTFIRLAGDDGTLSSLADAKLLLDMQAIVVANSSG